MGRKLDARGHNKDSYVGCFVAIGREVLMGNVFNIYIGSALIKYN
jgi:hypothetical protein